MLTYSEVMKASRNNELFSLANKLFSGGANFGVFERDGLVFKVYDKNCLEDLSIADEWEREAVILNDLSSEYFPRVVFSNPEYLVMEFFEGVSLKDYLEYNGSLPYWAKEKLNEVLTFVFSKSYIPNGFSPKNILINELKRDIKVIDVLSYQETLVLKLDQDYYYSLVDSSFEKFFLKSLSINKQ